MILPLRVLGNPFTNWILSGLAIGPMTRATVWLISFRIRPSSDLVAVEDHIRIDTLPFYLMRISHHRALHNARMHVDRIFNFRRTDPVPAYIQDVIHPPVIR